MAHRVNRVLAPLVNLSHTLDGADTSISSGSWSLSKVLSGDPGDRTTAIPQRWRGPQQGLLQEEGAQVSGPDDLQLGQARGPGQPPFSSSPRGSEHKDFFPEAAIVSGKCLEAVFGTEKIVVRE